MQTSQPVRIPSTAAKSKPAEVPSARQLNIGTTPPAGSLVRGLVTPGAPSGPHAGARAPRCPRRRT